MNQILVCEKLYITPQIKKKKIMFKFTFFLSIFLVCMLSTYYIYAEYDKNKSEQVSKEILASLTSLEEQEEKEKLESIVVVLNSAFSEEQEIDLTDEQIDEIPSVQIITAKDGTQYYTIGRINIPKIGVDYPIFSEFTVDLLKTSPCRFWGSDPNKEGNCCIVGHNYLNTKFFSKVPTLEYGDIIEITDVSRKTIKYSVYTKYEVDPEDTSCLDQDTDGRKEITLITCTNDGQKRVIVKAVAMKK